MVMSLQASEPSKIRIGILALQGAVIEHEVALKAIENVQPVSVRYPHELEGLQGIILPGGESTAIGKLLYKNDLMAPLKKAISEGLPVYGTCAGMILLAKDIIEEDVTHLGLMDISVRRNAYGGQLDSFIARMPLEGISAQPFPMVFIRAPWIESCENEAFSKSKINKVWRHEERIVAARQDHMLVTSFHPELTASDDLHRYFVTEMVNMPV